MVLYSIYFIFSTGSVKTFKHKPICASLLWYDPGYFVSRIKEVKKLVSICSFWPKWLNLIQYLSTYQIRLHFTPNDFMHLLNAHNIFQLQFFSSFNSVWILINNKKGIWKLIEFFLNIQTLCIHFELIDLNNDDKYHRVIHLSLKDYLLLYIS